MAMPVQYRMVDHVQFREAAQGLDGMEGREKPASHRCMATASRPARGGVEAREIVGRIRQDIGQRQRRPVNNSVIGRGMVGGVIDGNMVLAGRHMIVGHLSCRSRGIRMLQRENQRGLIETGNLQIGRVCAGRLPVVTPEFQGDEIAGEAGMARQIRLHRPSRLRVRDIRARQVAKIEEVASIGDEAQAELAKIRKK